MPDLRISVQDEQLSMLEGLTEALHMSRSEVAQNALERGLRVLRTEIALQRYLNEEYTLCQAARFAGTSIEDFGRQAAERGIPFFRYSRTDLAADADRTAQWFE